MDLVLGAVGQLGCHIQKWPNQPAHLNGRIILEMLGKHKILCGKSENMNIQLKKGTIGKKYHGGYMDLFKKGQGESGQTTSEAACLPRLVPSEFPANSPPIPAFVLLL